MSNGLMSPTTAFLARFTKSMQEQEDKILSNVDLAAIDQHDVPNVTMPPASVQRPEYSAPPAQPQGYAAQLAARNAAARRASISSGVPGGSRRSSIDATAIAAAAPMPTPSAPPAQPGGTALGPTVSGILRRLAPSLAADLLAEPAPPSTAPRSRSVSFGRTEELGPSFAAHSAAAAASSSSSAATAAAAAAAAAMAPTPGYGQLNASMQRPYTGGFSAATPVSDHSFMHTGRLGAFGGHSGGPGGGGPPASLSPSRYSPADVSEVVAQRDKAHEQIKSLLGTLQSLTEETARVRAQNFELQKERDATREQAAEDGARHSYLQAETSAAANALGGDVARLRARVLDLESQVDKERARADAAEAQVKDASKADIEILRAQRDMLGLQKDIIAEQTRTQEARAEAAACRAELVSVQQALRAAEARLSEHDPAAHQQEIATLMAARDEAAEALASFRENAARQMAGLQSTIAELQRSVTLQSTKMAGLKAELSRMVDQRDAAMVAVESSKEEAAELQQRVSELEREVTAARTAPPPTSPRGVTLLKEGTDLMAVMMYAQNLEGKVDALHRQVAAARMAGVLQRAVSRRLRQGFMALAGLPPFLGGAGLLPAHPPAPAAPRLQVPPDDTAPYAIPPSPSPAASHLSRLEQIAATPLAAVTGLAGPASGHAGGGSGSTAEEDAVADLDAALADLALLAHNLHRELSSNAASGSAAAAAQAAMRVGKHLHNFNGVLSRARGQLQSLRLQAPRGGTPTLTLTAADGSISLADTMSREMERSSESQARLRASLHAALERADRSDEECSRQRREAAELRLRLQALHSAASQLLAGVGCPARLSSVKYMQSAGGGADGLTSPGGAAARPTSASAGSSSSGAAAAVTPEALMLALAHVQHVKQQLDGLRAVLAAAEPRAADGGDASASAAAASSSSAAAAAASVPLHSMTLRDAAGRLEAGVLAACRAGATPCDAAAEAAAAYQNRVRASAAGVASDTDRLKAAELSMDSIRAARVEAEEATAQAHKQICELRAQVASLEHISAKREAEGQALQEELKTATASLASTTVELESARAAAARARADAENVRSKALEAMTAARHAFEKDMATVQQERGEVSSKLAATQAELARAQGELATAKEALAAATAAGEASQADIRRLQEELVQLRETSAEHLTAVQTELQHRFTTTSAAMLRQYEERLARLQGDHDADRIALMRGCEERVSKLTSEIEGLQGLLSAAAEARTTATTLSGDNAALRESLEAAHRSSAASAEEARVLREQVASFQSALREVTSELELQVTEAEASRADLDKLAAMLSAAQKEIQRLQGEAEAAAAAQAALKEAHEDKVRELQEDAQFALQAAQDKAEAYVQKMLAGRR